MIVTKFDRFPRRSLPNTSILIRCRRNQNECWPRSTILTFKSNVIIPDDIPVLIPIMNLPITGYGIVLELIHSKRKTKIKQLTIITLIKVGYRTT